MPTSLRVCHTISVVYIDEIPLLFSFFLANWQEREALCKPWSLARGPPSFTGQQPNYPQKCQVTWRGNFSLVLWKVQCTIEHVRTITNAEYLDEMQFFLRFICTCTITAGPHWFVYDPSGVYQGICWKGHRICVKLSSNELRPLLDNLDKGLYFTSCT